MGCTQSNATAEKPAAKAADSEQKPRVFAIMRNGHDVIRGAQRDVKEMIEKDDLDGATELWEKHKKWMFLHMTMEEGTSKDGSPMGMFRLLNEKFDGIANNGKLAELHVILHEKEEAVEEAFKAKDIAKLKEVFPPYDKINLNHLVKEEEIMMPKVMEMQKAGENVKKLMREELLDTVSGSPDFEFFVKFANEMLDKHPEGQPRARVWDHALWALATEEEWTVWDAWIKESLKPETYKELQDAIEAFNATKK
mmetsp:Transcript_14070/g.18348  ORF Transcript_14070/g.18348 Transcript_14070/m.18348 type:complete len:252 (+) Transcript_14070:243-998(+)|eukprot:CAMPEP_0198146500 /NCGR_PEP_ID=MMETSP1443-20131203/29613_1 /TAXON_ID=186043 /ORGANISM="Entomoneis sp., Strain CCMP2396" /LENGTH=251 /DNA_ID=CAMNT_0043810487 /DNA_START=173 /DNA_END=928 /DNA_ORIENTATION=-